MNQPLHRRACGRVRDIRNCIQSPGDILLATRMFVWRASVPVLKWLFPLPRLARLMWSGRQRPERDRARELRIVALSEALCGPHGGRLLDNCLERSLVSYRFLAQAGAQPELAFGVARDKSDPVRGHAWVRLDGQPVHDSAEALTRFEELGAFGPNGALNASVAPSGEPAATPRRPARSQ